MKKNYKILVVFLILLLFPIRAEAASSSGNIIIDGNFDDWTGKPTINDTIGDISYPWQDVSKLSYFTDQNYLYLCVTRESGVTSFDWDLDIFILNPEKNSTKLDKTVSNKINQMNKNVTSSNSKNKNVYASVFEVRTYYAYDYPYYEEKGIVDVTFGNKEIESTYSASKDGKKIEFRIPLNLIGLSGFDKQIRFFIASHDDFYWKHGYFYYDEVDWVPDEGSILVTTGGTNWKLTTAVFFISVSAGAFIVYKKKYQI